MTKCEQLTVFAQQHSNFFLPCMPWAKMSVRFVLAASVLASTAYVLLWLAIVWRHHAQRKKARVVNKVLFFPDLATSQQLASAYSHRSMCSTATAREGVKAQDIAQGSLWELFGTLQHAKRSIDVCMMTVASRELSDTLIAAHQAGVIVRVVTNNEQMMYSGTQVGRLRQAGIQVRIDETEFLMHHKFALVDGELLMSGSLNWTRHGLCGNQENVIITSETKLVQPFLDQFELLWDKYNPQQDVLT